MNKAVKVLQARQNAILKAVDERPGVTTAELVSIIEVDSAKLVSNAMWQLLKSGKVLAERIVRDGRQMNAYYRPEQIDADSVERIKQKLVDAQSVVPIGKQGAARTSVFDVPNASRLKKKSAARKSPSRTVPAPVRSAAIRSPDIPSRAFACAVTSDGSLVLMRQGQVEFALSDTEAATLQSYLVKRAAASLFASMA